MGWNSFRNEYNTTGTAQESLTIFRLLYGKISEEKNNEFSIGITKRILNKISEANFSMSRKIEKKNHFSVFTFQIPSENSKQDICGEIFEGYYEVNLANMLRESILFVIILFDMWHYIWKRIWGDLRPNIWGRI